MAFGINNDMLAALEEEGKATETITTTEEKTAEELAAEKASDESAEDLDNKMTPEVVEKKDTPDPAKTEAEKQTPEVVAPTDEQILAHLKGKGYELDSVDDFFKEKEAPVETPYSKLIEADAEVKAFLDFKKDTNRSLSDFVKAQENIDDISILDLALGQARSDNGSDLSREDLISIIEDELNVDLSDLDGLTAVEKARLNKFTKEYKKELLAEKEKYKIPAVNENGSQEEVVKLADGQVVPKSVFEAHEKNRQTYLQETKAAVDSVAKTTLNVEFDNNGKKESVAVDYEHDVEDKKSMLALSSDLDKTVSDLFRTEKGFNHQDFAKAVWRLDPKNWEKEVSSIVNKALAENTLVMQKNDNNVNFNTNQLSNKGNGGSGKKELFSGDKNGFGVKFNLDN